MQLHKIKKKNNYFVIFLAQILHRIICLKKFILKKFQVYITKIYNQMTFIVNIKINKIFVIKYKVYYAS